MSIIVEGILDDGTIILAELNESAIVAVEGPVEGAPTIAEVQDGVIEVLMTTDRPAPQNLFIQQFEPTPEQTEGLSAWEWVELNPDGTIKTRWIGTP